MDRQEQEKQRLSELVKKRLYTGEGLMEVETPPIAWAIEGVLPEGLNLLAAKPKVGKSTYATDAGIAIAHGEMFLGKYQTDQGKVLYVSIDDTAINRMQERLKRRLQGRPLPDEVQYAFDWSLIGKGDTGLEEFAIYVDSHGDGKVKAIVVDVLPNILPPFREDAGAYQAYYDFLPPLKIFAHDNHIAVLALVHKNKANSTGGGLLDGIYGNVALSAIADNILVIDELPSKQRVLRTKGKDIPEDDLYLKYNRETEQSVVGEPTSGVETSGIARPVTALTRIQALLDSYPDCMDMRAGDIFDVMENQYHINVNTSKGALKDMRERGLVDVTYWQKTSRYRRPQTGCTAA